MQAYKLMAGALSTPRSAVGDGDKTDDMSSCARRPSLVGELIAATYRSRSMCQRPAGAILGIDRFASASGGSRLEPVHWEMELMSARLGQRVLAVIVGAAVG
ncbi:hypothetical protein GCM10025874_12740 [Arenivirga flava]|uniref:Uncharacterized protein n=1 Tax=Arenivirga flava TaxID=1930060 RepID=A0AA37XB40_9MICO|nr:hypothetical protein GCM10025874_12740 [Arenivirga flava]